MHRFRACFYSIEAGPASTAPACYIHYTTVPEIPYTYCNLDRDGTGASGPRGGCARDFVNFREKFMHRARAARTREFDSLPSDSDPAIQRYYAN